MAQTTVDLPEARVRAVQLALWDEDFNLEPELREFAHVYLANGRDGTAAVLAVRPHLGRDSAVTQANRWLGTRQPRKGRERASDGHPELLRYIAWRQAQAALRAQLTEDEVIAGARRVYLHAVGDVPVVKTMMYKDGGSRDIYAHDPNLAAARGALETLRAIGGFGKDLAAAATDQQARVLTTTERAARVAALLELRRRDLAEASDA